MTDPDLKSLMPNYSGWKPATPPLTGRHLRNLARIARGKPPRYPTPLAAIH